MKIEYQYIDYASDKRKRFHLVEYVVVRYDPVLQHNDINSYINYFSRIDFIKKYLFIPDYVVKDDILIQTNDTDNYFNYATSISASSNYPINNSNTVVIMTTKDTNIDNLIEYLKSKYAIKEVITDFNQLRQNHIEWRREQIGKI